MQIALAGLLQHDSNVPTAAEAQILGRYSASCANSSPADILPEKQIAPDEHTRLVSPRDLTDVAPNTLQSWTIEAQNKRESKDRRIAHESGTQLVYDARAVSTARLLRRLALGPVAA